MPPKIVVAMVWTGLCIFFLIALFDWYSSAIKIKPRWLRWIAYLLPVVIFAGYMVWGD
jgi:ABC-type multidrug transport system permease subunit